MADISNVINVQLLEDATLASRSNLNNVCIITSETGYLSTAMRSKAYKTLSDVATDHGTNSQVYDYASAFFGTSPNPISSRGYLYIGYWRAASETVAATAGTMTGAALDEDIVVAQCQELSGATAAFDIDVDGSTVSVTDLDLRSVTSLSGIATALSAAITGATVSVSDDNELVVTSGTTGASSAIGFMEDPGTGIFVGNILGLASGTGAVADDGAASATLSAEDMVDAITAIQAETGIFGAMFIDQPEDADVTDLSAYAQANNILIYDVFSDPANLTVASTNVVWQVKLASQKNYRMLYSAAGNRKLAASYMARVHTVNFAAENSAMTMHLKTLNVVAESYSDDQIAAAKVVGLDLYTTIKNVPIVMCSYGNGFVDNRYNLIGFIDAVQTDTFNLLHGSGTKVPQTTGGHNTIQDCIEKTVRGFVKCGVFAPGTWTSSDFFGVYAVFIRNIEQNGFYVMYEPLADQSASDRQQRKSTVFHIAVKNAGAVHESDIIINLNL